jgi:hypothetical protein
MFISLLPVVSQLRRGKEEYEQIINFEPRIRLLSTPAGIQPSLHGNGKPSWEREGLVVGGDDKILVERDGSVERGEEEARQQECS